METIKEFRTKYEAAKIETEKAKDYLARLETKKDKLAEGLPTLATEIDTKKAEAETAMQRYIADELSEAELAEVRREIVDLERKHREYNCLVGALATEIEKAQASVKEAREKTQRALDRFWFYIAQAESARARAAGATAIKRAYLATRRSSTPGCCPTLQKLIGDIFAALPLTAGEEATIYAEIEAEHGIPRL